ncbi:MAG: hypothetical protein WB987_03825, partial [Candidatus Acidiferrales bacterium]
FSTTQRREEFMTDFQYWFLIFVIVGCAALIGDEIRTAIHCLRDIESSIDALRPDESVEV